jgi:hypothetical protein
MFTPSRACRTALSSIASATAISAWSDHGRLLRFPGSRAMPRTACPRAQQLRDEPPVDVPRSPPSPGSAVSMT